VPSGPHELAFGESLPALLDSLEGLRVAEVERLDRGMVRLLLKARGTDDGDAEVFFHEADVRRPA
jgi:hypothetical protein